MKRTIVLIVIATLVMGCGFGKRGKHRGRVEAGSLFSSVILQKN